MQQSKAKIERKDGFYMESIIAKFQRDLSRDFGLRVILPHL